MDIFSTEFLESLRNQIATKPKSSKVLLDAIKQLTQTNQNNKRTITNLQNQIKQLRSQNNMLLQIIQTNKVDIDNRMKLKDKKIERGIQIQAELSAQNEGYRNQIEKLKQELYIYKNMATSTKGIHESTKNMDNQTGQKSLVELVSLNSENDLNAYLYSRKETERSMKQGDAELSLQIQADVNMKNVRGIKQRNKYNAQKQNDIELDKIGRQAHKDNKNRIKDEIFYSSILHGDDQDINSLNQ